MRFVVIGCGARARFHLDEVAAMDGLAVAAVCDADPEAVASTAEAHGIARTFTDWREMLRHVEADAAVLCLPHHLHAPAAIDCLGAGVHVLVENPIATTLDDADRMADAARAGDRTLMVGNSYRYTPACRTAESLVASGRIGKPTLCYGAWLGPRWMLEQSGWAARREQAGGGPLLGYGTHLFDLLEWMIGPIRSVDAAVSRDVVLDAEVEDSASVLLRFAGGASGSFTLSWADHTDRFRLDTEILGTKGRIAFSPRGGLKVSDAEGRELVDVKPADLSPHALYEEFLDAVATGREPLTGATTARRALACSLAAYRSAVQGRPVDVGTGEAE